MKISDLFNNEIEETFSFRGQTMYIIACPDIFTMADLKEFDENNAESIARFLAKGLKEFGVKEGEIYSPLGAEKGRQKDAVEINEKLFTGGMPVTLARQMAIRIQGLWASVEGKPQKQKI